MILAWCYEPYSESMLGSNLREPKKPVAGKIAGVLAPPSLCAHFVGTPSSGPHTMGQQL
jgi:hypothetical protein